MLMLLKRENHNIIRKSNLGIRLVIIVHDLLSKDLLLSMKIITLGVKIGKIYSLMKHAKKILNIVRTILKVKVDRMHQKIVKASTLISIATNGLKNRTRITILTMNKIMNTNKVSFVVMTLEVSRIEIIQTREDKNHFRKISTLQSQELK